MSPLWSKLGVAVIALLVFLALVPALQTGFAVFRRLMKRLRLAGDCSPYRFPVRLRFVVLLAFTVGLVYHGSTKGNGRMAVRRLSNEAPVVQTNNVASAWFAAEQAPGYVLAATGTAVTADFVAPATALHLARWVPGGRSDDFLAVPCPFTNLIVGINGTLTTAHRRLDKFPFPVTNALVVAPAFATNGLIPGVSEFWFTTNAAAARYVWHNVAFNRSSSNLVSFAATYCRNRDLIFEYGPAFPSNVLSLIQNGTNMLVLSAAEEMRLRFNQGFTNVPPFSYLCPSVFICGSGASCGALAEHCSNRSFRFSFIADLGDGTGDLDADGISNYNEVMLYGTDPRSADTDQDGLADGAELAAGTDPRSFDTDSDGLADSVDVNPTNFNGNCFGQSTNWWAAVYSTNVVAVTVAGDGTVDHAWTSEAFVDGSFTVSISVAVESNTTALVNADGQRIVTDKSDTFEVLLAPGEARDIAATCAITSVASAAPGVTVTRLDDHHWRVARPFVLEIAPAGGDVFGAGNFAAFVAGLAPDVAGAWSWCGSGVTVLSPASRSTTVVWDPENGTSSASLTCVWSGYGHAATNTVTLTREGNHAATTNDFLAVTIDGSDTGLVFIEDEYTNAPGEVVAFTSTVAKVECFYNGPAAGTLMLAANAAAADRIRLWDAPAVGGAPVALPRTWSVSGSDHQTFYVTGLTNSAAGNDIALTLSYRAAPPSTAAATSEPAKMTVVKIVSEAESDFPANKARHVFGPLESAVLQTLPAIPINWYLTGESGTNGIPQFSIIAPDHACPFTVVAVNGLVTLNMAFRVIEPDYFCDFSTARIMDDVDWYLVDLQPPSLGQPAVGLHADIRMLPLTVSFSRLWTMESYAAATNVTGCFADTNRYPVGSLDHGQAAGAFIAVQIEEGNIVCHDNAGRIMGLQDLGQEGGYAWDIHNGWFLKYGTVTNAIHWSRQTIHLYTNGTMSVSKFGHIVTRSTNGVEQLD